MTWQKSTPDWPCVCDPKTISYEQCSANVARCLPGAEEVAIRARLRKASADRREKAYPKMREASDE